MKFFVDFSRMCTKKKKQKTDQFICSCWVKIFCHRNYTHSMHSLALCASVNVNIFYSFSSRWFFSIPAVIRISSLHTIRWCIVENIISLGCIFFFFFLSCASTRCIRFKWELFLFNATLFSSCLAYTSCYCHRWYIHSGIVSHALPVFNHLLAHFLLSLLHFLFLQV